MDAASKRILLIGAGALLAVLAASFSLYWFYEGRVSAESELPKIGTLPSFSWTAADGTTVSSETLRGKVWFGYFFFSTCPGVCIPMTQEVKRMQSAVRDIPNACVVGITCDPEVDTPEVLAKYGKSHELDPTLVHLVRDEYESVQRFAVKTLHLGLEKASDEERKKGADKVYHSVRFFLIDAKGCLRGYYNGLEADETQKLLRDMARLAKSGSKESG
ncbi:MAG: hypothetical protein CSA62_11310 [Planctomycetota bacterium]|nr:MAG: hypothetical protein CSA62_11310 [Planctomycetota bacterium]